MKNSKICHATQQVCICSCVLDIVLQISCNVPQKLLGIFVYLVSTPKIISKLFWVLILVKTSEWIKTVWPFRDNATWNLIFKSVEKIREVQFDWSTLKKHIKFCSHWHQKKGVSLCLHVLYLCCKKINFFEILLIC